MSTKGCDVFDKTDVNVFNVKDYGANPDDTTDDTASIALAIAAIPSSATDKPSVLCFPLPTVAPGVGGVGAYKVSSTLDLRSHWSVHVLAPSRYSLNHTGTSDTRAALIKWYGAAGTVTAPNPVFLFGDSDMVILDNISVDCRDTGLTIGFALGATNQQFSQVKYTTGTNVDALHCAVGIRVGDYANNGPDDGSNVFTGSLVDSNSWAGVVVQSGNAAVHFINLTASGNGTAPPGGNAVPLAPFGGNILVNGGELTLSGYLSAGIPGPHDADIWVGAGGIKINGAWSDTHGRFLAASGVNLSGYVSGVRHYEGSMTTENTPVSIEWGGPQPLVLSGSYLFGNVQVDSGTATHVVDLGTRFASAGSGFTGDMVNTYLGYVGVAPYDGSNAARLSVGKPSTSATLTVAGSISTGVRTVTAATALTMADSVVLANLSSAATVTLPAAASASGRQVTVKSIGTAPTNVAPQNPDTIDGSPAERALSAQYQYLTLVSDGTNWNIVANN